MRKINWLLITAVIVAAGLRLTWLAKYPAGFTPDEAAFGYNAYSLFKTGRDEWGTSWWKLFFFNMRSFGDYKLPLYSFLAVPSVAGLGLTELAVRLPGAIFGVISVIGVYYLAKELFPEKKIAIIAAWLLVISPWHISLSRGAFEANLITFFLPWIIYFFLKKSYLTAAVFMAVSIYSYHSARYLAPLFLLILFLTQKLKLTGKLLLAVVVLVMLSLPAVVSVITTGHTRVGDISIFNPTDNWAGVASRRFEARNLGAPDMVARLFSNKLTQTASTFSHNYLEYLSPDFLFVSGAAEASHGMIPGRGVMYLLELVFVIAYLIALIKTKSPALVLMGWLLMVVPIPAALSKGLGHATGRAAPMIPILVIITAVGIDYLLSSYKKHHQLLAKVVGIAYAIALTFFIEDYLFHAPKITAPQMSYGWKELMPRLKGIAREYDQVQVSRSLSEPHIFVAFYDQVDPRVYQAQAKNWVNFNAQGLKFLDQYDGYTLGKYRFGTLDLSQAGTHKTLVVGKPQDIPPNLGQYFSIYFPDSSVAIQVSKATPSL